MEKLGLTLNKNINEYLKILLNIKLLCFTNLENIYYLYKKIKKKYKSHKFIHFLTISKNNGIQN